MDKETSVIALVIITILAVFVALQPVIPSNSEHFSELGILGPQQTIANYPTTLARGHPFLLYAYLGNHEGTAEYYELVVKLGNASTVISNSSAAAAPVISSHYYALGDGKNTTFPMQLSINENGTNLRVLFELWSFDTTSSTFAFAGLTDQLWVNVTS